MENSNEPIKIFGIEVDETGKSKLLEMSRWTKFLSIFGFICLGLCVLGIIILSVMMSMYTDISNSVLPVGVGLSEIIATYIIVIGVNIYPIYALYRFSVLVRRSFKSGDNHQFNKSLGHLKGFFTYVGVLVVLTIVLFLFSVVYQGYMASR